MNGFKNVWDSLSKLGTSILLMGFNITKPCIVPWYLPLFLGPVCQLIYGQKLPPHFWVHQKNATVAMAP